jgi:hypothetical protein
LRHTLSQCDLLPEASKLWPTSNILDSAILKVFVARSEELTLTRMSHVDSRTDTMFDTYFPPLLQCSKERKRGAE